MMRVKDLLKAKGGDVYFISPEATVYDALKLMGDKDVGALVVLEGNRSARALHQGLAVARVI